MSILLKLFLMFIVTPLMLFGCAGIFIVTMFWCSDQSLKKLAADYSANPDLVRERLAIKLGKE